MSQRRQRSLPARLAGWDETWALAIVFGLASIPWTYAFVAGLSLPLWPSFIASATFYAAGGSIDGLKRGYASNAAGIAYAAATLVIVDAFLGGGVLALSVVVGVFMFLASLHEYVPLLSFTPGGVFRIRDDVQRPRCGGKRVRSPRSPRGNARCADGDVHRGGHWAYN